MSEERSVKDLKSRFEGLHTSTKPIPAAKPSSARFSSGHGPTQGSKPVVKEKPKFQLPVRTKAVLESPKPLTRTDTNDSCISDPFGSPMNSPAVEVPPKLPSPRTKPRLITKEDELRTLQSNLIMTNDSLDYLSTQPSGRALGSDLLRPISTRPAPPSPRVKSPRPVGRASAELTRPVALFARDLFTNDIESENASSSPERLPNMTSRRPSIPARSSSDESRPSTPISRPRSRIDVFAIPPLPSNRPQVEQNLLSHENRYVDEIQSRSEGNHPQPPSKSLSSSLSSLSTSPTLPSAGASFQVARQLKRSEVEGSKPALPVRPASIQSFSSRSISKISTISEVTSPVIADQKPQLPRRMDTISSVPPSSLASSREPIPQLPSRSHTVDSSRSIPDQRRVSLQHDRCLPEMPSNSRRSLDTSRTGSTKMSSTNVSRGDDDSEGEEDNTNTNDSTRASEQPDASTANRKPPRFKGTHWDLPTGKEVRKTALSGDLLMVAHNDKLKLHNLLTNEITWQIPVGDTKVTAMEFRTVTVHNLSDAGRFLWVAFKDGSLHELDLRNRMVVERYFHAHSGAIIAILRNGRAMWTLDEGGNLQMWSDNDAISLKGRPSYRTIRTVIGASTATVVNGLLWVGTGRTVHVFDPDNAGNHRITPERGLEPNRTTGLITCVIHLSHVPDHVYFGHDDGKISVYSTSTFKFLEVFSVSHYNLSGLLAVGDYLWASFKTGKIFIYDVHHRPWRVMKEWHAHKSPIMELAQDRCSLWKEKRLQVSSMAGDGAIRIWDGLLMEDWLDAEMQKRVKDFCTFQSISVLVCTWNAGASAPQKLGRDYEDSQFMEAMIKEAGAPDMIVFGFQELVDLDDKGKAGRSVAKGFFGKKKEKEPDEKSQAAAYQQWQNHLERQVSIASSAREGYTLLQVRNLVGLFTCVFVRQDIRKRICNVEATNVKTGLKGRYGNKGGIVIRFTLDDSSICLVNCHLAAGQKHVMARNNDIFSILDQAGLSAASEAQIKNNVFVSGGDGSMVLDHEICILNGDLNYRINGNRTHVLQNIKDGKLGKLFESDQLSIELKKNATHRLRSFTESPIQFQPTYKYDPGTDDYDSSEKMRIPAWCDRIFYRGMGSSEVEGANYRAHTCRVSDHRPVSALLTMQVKTVDPELRKQIFDAVAKQWIVLANKAIVACKITVLKDITGRKEKECRDALRNSEGQLVSEAAKALLGI